MYPHQRKRKINTKKKKKKHFKCIQYIDVELLCYRKIEIKCRSYVCIRSCAINKLNAMKREEDTFDRS